MKYIVGLGNPGPDFVNTRHNVGVMFVDFLRKNFNENRKEKKVKDSVMYSNSGSISVIKTNKFMNEIGIAVKDIVKYLKIDIGEELYIAHDDLDIELGNYKVQYGKSPKEHNGVISVEQHLKTIKFHRIRIGVDNRKNFYMEGKKYVLGKFDEQELKTVNSVFMSILEEIV